MALKIDEIYSSREGEKYQNYQDYQNCQETQSRSRFMSA
jgi:hypothetical protein